MDIKVINNMKMIKIMVKIVLVCILSITIIIAGIALYMKFYGKGIIEGALSNMLGAKIRFDNISLNLDEYIVNFKGFSIPSEIGFEDRSIFNAESFGLVLNREKFEKEKKVAFDHIFIIKGELNIERNKKGYFNISHYKEPEGPGYTRGVCYAAPAAGGINLYRIAKDVKRLDIEDSVINFKDYYLPQGAFSIRCDNFNVTFDARPQEEDIYNAIPIKLTVNFNIPGRHRRGEFTLDADIYALKNKADMDMKIFTIDTDLMQFAPYFNSFTPFSFQEGVFNSQTDLSVRENAIDSLTTMVFRRLRLFVDPGMENARFLETSVNKLVPYLMSERGEIVFDFVIKGPLDEPQIGLGPHVKFAIGMAVVEEVGNILQQFQKLRR